MARMIIIDIGSPVIRRAINLDNVTSVRYFAGGGQCDGKSGCECTFSHDDIKTFDSFIEVRFIGSDEPVNFRGKDADRIWDAIGRDPEPIRVRTY